MYIESKQEIFMTKLATHEPNSIERPCRQNVETTSPIVLLNIQRSLLSYKLLYNGGFSNFELPLLVFEFNLCGPNFVWP